MQNRITGTTMPVLEFLLDPNESIISEAGELSWMSSSIQMTTHTQFAGGGGLAWSHRPSRNLAGARIHDPPPRLSLCHPPQIQNSVGFQQSPGAGIFGGDGFLLQRLSRLQTIFLELLNNVGGGPCASHRCQSRDLPYRPPPTP